MSVRSLRSAPACCCICAHFGTAHLMSCATPHVFHLLACLQFDVKFATEGSTNFIPFDFNAPEQIPLELHQSFDFVVIDPPFITKEVWEKYADTAKLLVRGESSKILLTTIGTRCSYCQSVYSMTQMTAPCVATANRGEREDDTTFARMPTADIQALDPAPRVPVCTLHKLPLPAAQFAQSGD